MAPVFRHDLESWQRVDFQLLKHGAVSVFFDEGVLDDAGSSLQGLGYIVAAVDAASCGDATAIREAGSKAIPGWQPHWGTHNRDAFNDAMGDVEFNGVEGIALTLRQFDNFASRPRVMPRCP